MKGEIAAKAPIRIEVEKGKTYWWCACGRSANQPFCDGSHKGSEFSPIAWEAGSDGEQWFCACKQTDNRPFCDGTHNTLDDNEAKAPVIEQRENGPLVIKNLEHFTDHHGNEIETRQVMALCRCGHSKNKPFCDGSHQEAGFSSANETENPDGRLFSYEGSEVTVYFNKLLCSHAAECGRHNRDVFNVQQKPWVQPDEGSAESIREVIHACPSGALTFSQPDGEARHLVGDEAKVRVERHGPYQVRNVKIDDARFAESASQEKFVLCRCGLSKNKPFCDGTHLDAKWRDDA